MGGCELVAAVGATGVGGAVWLLLLLLTDGVELAGIVGGTSEGFGSDEAPEGLGTGATLCSSIAVEDPAGPCAGVAAAIVRCSNRSWLSNEHDLLI